MLLNKVLITGEASVGKTSISSLIKDQSYPEIHVPTNLASFFQISYSNEEKTITVNVWDVGGSPEYEQLTLKYFRGIDIAVLVFDLTQPHTFQRLYEIAPAIAQLSQNTHPFFLLVGNKSDLSEERAVSAEQIDSLKAELCCQYFQVSAKDKSSVDSLTKAIGDTCIAKFSGVEAPVIKLKAQTDGPTCCSIC